MKNIAIIGSGNIGGSLARLIAPGANYSVTVGSRDPRAAREKLGSIPVADYATAVRSAEIVILAVPFPEIATIAESLGDLAGKTVVDVTNPLTPDFMGLTLGYSTSAGEIIQATFPKAKVVKAFNTVLAQVLQVAAAGAGSLPSVLIAGDDAAANEEVLELAREIGFPALDTGALTNARYLEPLAELGIQLAYGKGHGGEAGFTFVKAA